MRHAGTRPLVRRMQAIDQALRARKWSTDKTLARDLEVDPRTIRRDIEFILQGSEQGVFGQADTAPHGMRPGCNPFRPADRRHMMIGNPSSPKD
jgi:hypothetical protein